MLLSAGSRDLQHIYEAIASTGYNVKTKLKLEIQTKCFESKTNREFFDELAKAISSKNFCSLEDQNKFKELVGNNNTDFGTKGDLVAKLHDQEKLGIKLDSDLIDAENERRKLQLQLSAMDDLKTKGENKNDLMKQSLNRIKINLDTRKRKHKIVLQQYGGLLMEVKKSCSTINRHYSKNTGCPKKISDLSLDKWFEAERGFLSVLTKYAKRQFLSRSSFIDQSIIELSLEQNMNDTSDDNTQETFQKQEIEIDIKICRSGYAPRKKWLIVAAAELAESEAKLNFLTQNLNKNLRGSRFNEIELNEVSTQIVHLKGDALDQLLKCGSELEKVLFTSVDLRQELAEKKYFTNKQAMIMSLLNQQCVRYSAMSMLLKLESAKTEYISNMMRKFFEFLTNEQNSLVARISALPPRGSQEKEGSKAVIDNRDTLMLSFHDLLGISGNSMFPTFSSVYEAIEDLQSQKHEYESHRTALVNSITQLDDSLKACSKPLKSESGITSTPLSILQIIKSLQSNTNEISSIVQGCVTKMEREISPASKN